MGLLAWVLAILGGLCALVGVITAAGVIVPLGAAFTAMFWLALSAVLFLACIAATVASSGGYE